MGSLTITEGDKRVRALLAHHVLTRLRVSAVQATTHIAATTYTLVPGVPCAPIAERYAYLLDLLHKRGAKRVEHVLTITQRGARRAVRRYRLACFALGVPVPHWARR